jgi:hypothetical protein
MAAKRSAGGEQAEELLKKGVDKKEVALLTNLTLRTIQRITNDLKREKPQEIKSYFSTNRVPAWPKTK